MSWRSISLPIMLFTAWKLPSSRLKLMSSWPSKNRKWHGPVILLDLSAAFNTIDHNTLLGRLETRFTVTGTALNWLRSYLTNRTQAVAVGNPLLEGSRSAFVLLTSGIPQGSVLGPILFTIYTARIGDICRNNHIEFTFMQMIHKFTFHSSPVYLTPNSTVLPGKRSASMISTSG